MARDKVELVSVAVIVGLGIFYLYLAYSIRSYQEELMVGPRLVPMVIAALGIGLGILQFTIARVRRAKRSKADNPTLSSTSKSNSSALTKIAVFRMVAVILIGFAFIWLFSAAGYLIATAISIAALLVVFGTRNIGKVAMLTVGGTAAYYIIFIQLMGIYAPPGWLINLEILGLGLS